MLRLSQKIRIPPPSISLSHPLYFSLFPYPQHLFKRGLHMAIRVSFGCGFCETNEAINFADKKQALYYKCIYEYVFGYVYM